MRIEELEKKLSKEKKRSKKSNNGEEVKKLREEFTAAEAALRGELNAAREQLAKAEAAAATPQARSKKKTPLYLLNIFFVCFRLYS